MSWLKSRPTKNFKDRYAGLHETGDGNRILDGSPFLHILCFLYLLNFFCFPAAPNSSTIATAIESRTASALCA